jgi:hypothetical protein
MSKGLNNDCYPPHACLQPNIENIGSTDPTNFIKSHLVTMDNQAKESVG